MKIIPRRSTRSRLAVSTIRTVCSVAVVLGLGVRSSLAQERDIVVADFEGADYGDWKISGTAFGTGPAQGTLPGQMHVDGYAGNGLVNSFHDGDASTGRLTSPPFVIQRKYLQFLIGGGGFAGKTCLNLLLDGKVVRTATGPNTQAGGSEHLDSQAWDVSELTGKSVVLEIVDQATGGWGHINVDQIIQTDQKIPGFIQTGVTREIQVEKRYLNLPVKNGAPKRTLQLLAGGKTEREFQIELADGTPDWWAFLDVSAFRGQPVVLRVDKLREDSLGLKQVDQSDEIKNTETTYHEALRPQFHFSARRGWNNDPNGMVFYQGVYHLFFQHNPYGWDWGNMHWGHATSGDLLHWDEQTEALYPDALGMIYSGSAVEDWQNTSGFGKDGRPPLVLIYTAAGDQFGQCLAYCGDGSGTFTKYAHNPVIPQITGGNRDPKVFWHEPTKHWVMVLWVELEHRNTIRFLTSPNLKDWTMTSQVNDFFECPDFFELEVDGNPSKKKWVLTAANSEYQVGKFDGKTFTAETPKLHGVWSGDFYAAQTFSDMLASDGRRIQIGWLRAPSPGMPFNQCMSLPQELKLMSTADGPRLTRQPVGELLALRRNTNHLAGFTLKAGDANPLAQVSSELQELRTEFEPAPDSIVKFDVRGVPVSYDAAKQELTVAGRLAPAPLRDGKQRLVIYIDRTTIEVFASDGLTHVPKAVIAKSENLGIEVSVKGGPIQFSDLSAFELRGIWQ